MLLQEELAPIVAEFRNRGYKLYYGASLMILQPLTNSGYVDSIHVPFSWDTESEIKAILALSWNTAGHYVR